MTDDQQVSVLDASAEPRNERREFFRTALGAAAVTATGAAALTVASVASAQTVADLEILNFLLNLEYLEAQFYSFAATGAGLPAAQLTGTGTAGAATGGRAVTFTDPLVAQYASELAQEQAAHVAYLRSRLTTLAVAQPAIDLTPGGAFTTFARAANIVAAGVTFDPYASDTNFLLAAFMLEDVGATAYNFALSLITDKTNQEAIAGLIATESYHAALIRTVLYTKGATTASLRTQADAISNVRDSLDGATVDSDQGISAATVGTNLVSNIIPTGPDGLAFGRLPANVLNILYQNSASVSRGGFFPAGVNGTVVASTAN